MASENLVIVSDAEFKTKVLGSDKPVLVDFWAEWCGPCKMIAPYLEELADEFKGKVVIAKVNVDENPQFAGEYAVRSIPTLIMFKGGKDIDMVVGADPGRIRKLVESA